MAVSVVRVDPYDPVTGLLVPIISQRMLEMARLHCTELDPEQLVKSTMVKLWARDPAIGVLAFVDEKGVCVGHCIASMETDGRNRWVFVSQVKADGNVGDAVARAIEVADQWGRDNGATMMLMATGRSEKAWERKYGFKLSRRVMDRKIGDKESDEK